MSPPELGAAADLLGFPHKIQIQTYDSCNYKCGACPYPETSEGKPRTKMEAALLSRIIAEVREERRRVRLCLMLQNEPLLDRRFLDLLDEAHAADDAIESISTVTNGSMLNAALLDRMVAYDRFQLTVSINANDGERYRQVHGVDLWDRVIGLLESWSGPRQRVRLSFVVDRSSIEDARRFWARWEGQGYETRLVPILSRAGLVSLTSSRRTAEDDFGHCHYPVDTLTVLATGDVILCCQDWEHVETFGNLHQQSIREVWASTRAAELRAAAIDGTIRRASETCRGCDYPMRSVVRMELEAIVGGEPVTRPADQGVMEHVAELRLGDAAALPVVVYDIDPDGGSVSCAVGGPGLPELDEFAGSFAIRIAQSDRFSFGSLTPMWCPATVRRLEAFTGADSMPIATLRIDLDPSADAFRLLPWYAADWRRAPGRRPA